MAQPFKELLRAAEARGWTVDQNSGGKHLKLRRPGCRVVVCSRTPSDHRALKNIAADLRRAEKAGTNDRQP